MTPKRLLIIGGPGSGCTSTARALGGILGLAVLDSDDFFHKPTDPPFQEPYSPEERRDRLSSALASHPAWILAGSIATWELPGFRASHGILLDVPASERQARLLKRQQSTFGSRIERGGDLEEEHRAFIEWAAAYDLRQTGRCAVVDRRFLETNASHVLILEGTREFDEVVRILLEFLKSTGAADSLPGK